jgi:hypothetical protein
MAFQVWNSPKAIIVPPVWLSDTTLRCAQG